MPPRLASIAAIDAKIRALQDQILQLSTQRNELLLISTLPPEIFTSIVKRSLYQEYTKIRTVANRLSVISGVCRYWRETITSCKYLWTCIDTNNPDLIATCLSRSDPVPLLVRDPDQPAWDDMFKKILPRTKWITIANHKKLPLSEAWQNPAPVLEYLAGVSIALPKLAFGGIAPRLWGLRLAHSSWETISPFTTLTNLIIHYPPKRISVAEMLNGINPLQALSHLSLHSALHNRGAPNHTPRNPRLLGQAFAALSLADHAYFNALAEFLEQSTDRINKKTSLTWFVWGDSPLNGAFKRLNSRISCLWSNPTVTYLALVQKSSCCLDQKMEYAMQSTETSETSSSESAQPLMTSLRKIRSNCEVTFNLFAQDLPESQSLSNLKSLTFMIDDWESGDLKRQMADTFGHLPHLTELRIPYHEAPGLFKLIWGISKGDPSNQLFPALDVLSLVVSQDDSGHDGGKQIARSLFVLLSVRIGIGLGPNRLVIEYDVESREYLCRDAFEMLEGEGWEVCDGSSNIFRELVPERWDMIDPEINLRDLWANSE